MNEGSFAFKSQNSIKQEFEALAFEERDLGLELLHLEQVAKQEARSARSKKMHSFLDNKSKRRENIASTNDVPLEAPIKNGIQIFKLEHIRYKGDRKLPFMVLKDVVKVT